MSRRILLIERDLGLGVVSEAGASLRGYFGEESVVEVSGLGEGFDDDFLGYDLILVSLSLGEGLGLLAGLLGVGVEVPIVIVAEGGRAEDARLAIAGGACDYVVKTGGWSDGLGVLVEKNLAIWGKRQEAVDLRAALEKRVSEAWCRNDDLDVLVGELEMASRTDPLTGLSNRRAFNDALDRCFSESVRYHHDLSCVMIDLDGFKQLNDALGHQAGDMMLQLTGEVLVATSRRYDVAARLGGDEFTLLLPQTDEFTGLQVAGRIAEAFDRVVGEKFAELGVEGIGLTMSLGLASRVRCGSESGLDLIGCADKALYAAKHGGKKQLRSFSELSE